MKKISFCERYMLTTAVLNRTKELTRRLEKALERAVEDYKKKYGEEPVIKYQEWVREGNFLRVHCEHGLLSFQTRYKLGEVVAVAQSYSTILNELEEPHNFTCMEHWESASAKRAHYAEFLQMKDCPGWTNKLFVSTTEMIHQIQITGVRIERLQAVSNDDCLKEGVYYDADVDGYKVANLSLPNKGFRGDCLRQKYFFTPREAFAALINRPGVGRKGLWESNPWVVVYEFKLIK